MQNVQAIKSKKLAKGLDSLIPAATARIETKPECQTQEQIAGAAVGKVAMVISESLAGVEDHVAERMLRMIIALCQSELKGGYHG